MRISRLIKQAVEAKKPVLVLSTGPTRADGLPGIEKLDFKAGPLLHDVLDLYLE
jgi:NAD-dependent deacetylase sirtuin 4